MNVELRWHGDEFQKALIPGLQAALNAAAYELQAVMVKNTMGGSFERRVSGKSDLSMTKTGAVRIDKNTGHAKREWRTGLWGSLGEKQFQGKRIPISDFGGRIIVPGHAYYVGKSSAPGGFPFMRTGRFNQSIEVMPAKGLAAYVGSNVPYARRLEFGYFGTDSLGRTYHTAARPWASKSVAQARTAMQAAFNQVAAKAVYEATRAAATLGKAA